MIYYKEFDTFLATDSYILLEIKNPFEKFDFDFCIDWLDIKTIKYDILNISIDSIDWQIIKIQTKDRDFFFRYKTDLKIPLYKNILDKFTPQTKDLIYVSPHYARFFEIVQKLWFDQVVFWENQMKASSEEFVVFQQLQKQY